jgi:hypothetical protein
LCSYALAFRGFDCKNTAAPSDSVVHTVTICPYIAQLRELVGHIPDQDLESFRSIFSETLTWSRRAGPRRRCARGGGRGSGRGCYGTFPLDVGVFFANFHGLFFRSRPATSSITGFRRLRRVSSRPPASRPATTPPGLTTMGSPEPGIVRNRTLRACATSLNDRLFCSNLVYVMLMA